MILVKRFSVINNQLNIEVWKNQSSTSLMIRNESQTLKCHKARVTVKTVFLMSLSSCSLCVSFLHSFSSSLLAFFNFPDKFMFLFSTLYMSYNYISTRNISNNAMLFFSKTNMLVYFLFTVNTVFFFSLTLMLTVRTRVKPDSLSNTYSLQETIALN